MCLYNSICMFEYQRIVWRSNVGKKRTLLFRCLMEFLFIWTISDFFRLSKIDACFSFAFIQISGEYTSLEITDLSALFKLISEMNTKKNLEMTQPPLYPICSLFHTQQLLTMFSFGMCRIYRWSFTCDNCLWWVVKWETHRISSIASTLFKYSWQHVFVFFLILYTFCIVCISHIHTCTRIQLLRFFSEFPQSDWKKMILRNY